MTTERLSMRKTREILRQVWSLAQSHRDAARSLVIGTGTARGIREGRDRPGVESDPGRVAGLAHEIPPLVYPDRAQSRVSRKRRPSSPAGARIRTCDGPRVARCVPVGGRTLQSPPWVGYNPIGWLGAGRRVPGGDRMIISTGTTSC
jgi:hypothetical protein